MKIIAFSFGCGKKCIANKLIQLIIAKNDWRKAITILSKKVNPGASNFAIACKVCEISLVNQYYIQWEIAIALYLKHKTWFCNHIKQIQIIWPKKSGYINSYEILTEINPLYPSILVMHPAMKNRVSAIYKKIVGNNPIILFSDLVYDFYSTQWWTKCSLFWLIYDSLAMVHHRLKGWI